MISRQEMMKVLRQVAGLREDEHETAVAEGNWRAAFEARLTNLVWRAIALSLELQIASPQFDPSTDPIQLARRLKVDCDTALTTLTPTEDKSAPFYKLQTIGEVLDGIIDAVGVLEAWKGTDPREPFFLASKAIALGQVEVELSLAEDGHWEQVAQWRGRKVGRPKGSRAAWRIEAAPLIQAWISDDPQISRDDLAQKLAHWLAANWRRFNQKRPSPPQLESLGDLMRDMANEGLITLNPVNKKGGKKRKTNPL